MIKKMWAMKDKKTGEIFAWNDKKYKTNKKCSLFTAGKYWTQNEPAGNTLYEKSENEQVVLFLTDKDPFENVRKLMDDNLDYNYNPVDLENAILKDKTNFDNLPASGESLTGELGIVKTKKERL